MKKIFKIILIIFVAASLMIAIGGTLLIIKAYKELPNLNNLIDSYNPNVPTKIYDSDGNLIDVLYKEIRETVSIDSIPITVRDAFVAIEDKRFYLHHGFDIIGFTRAMVINLLTMSKAQGASTITQQLTKNAFLSNQKKIMRKVKEALIAIKLERSYTKDEILEKYLNEIYFGSGAYGVQTASKIFFGKNIENVNIAEGALLAAVPNRPDKYNLRRHLNNAVAREKLVLYNMRSNKFITKKEYSDAMDQKFYNENNLPDNLKGLSPEKLSELKITVIKNSTKKRNYNTPDFTNIVEQQLSKIYTEKQLNEGGLEVYTTLDSKMQKAANDAFANYKPLIKEKELDGGLVTIESNTGYVRAVIGGKNYKSGDFNRGIYAKRQPGSAFKPFVYFTAIRNGYAMNRVIEDTPIQFGKWKPRNFSLRFRKNFTILQAMEKSINIIAIKILQQEGLKELGKTVNLAGGENIKIPQNLTTALGTMVVSPFELSSLYLPFANGGYKIKPEFITKIKNRYGKVIYTGNIKQEKVFDENNVALITYMLEDVVKFGSGRKARVKKNGVYITQGGKTGTTNRQRTAWFAGITPNYVTTIYLGYDDNRPMSRSSTGGGLTAKLCGDYYQNLVDNGDYTGNNFNYIDDGLKNGKLTLLTIDSRNGVLADQTSGVNKREAIFLKGSEPMEMATKYNTDFNNFFIKTSDIKKTDEIQSSKNIKQNKTNLESDSMFKDLFKN